jgi:hypothetical protein
MVSERIGVRLGAELVQELRRAFHVGKRNVTVPEGRSLRIGGLLEGERDRLVG